MTSMPWRFWHLLSQALPVGAYQYSQGLESAIVDGVVSESESAQNWLLAVLQESVALVDLPLITRVYIGIEQCNDDEVRRWDHLSIAYRETNELRREERQMGAALIEWTKSVGETVPVEVHSFTAAFALVAHNSGVSMREAVSGFAWMWLENMCLIATKMVPLGHLESQRMLRSLCEQIEPAVQRAVLLQDHELGSNSLGLLMLSARHEMQPARLFRS
ncbi:MAG: urease accessory UreF family protein [Pseudomonadales bacterium]|nr:urease accessory UreF family protein [Pseudomonadales bacterium]